jgi:hypothetical protein
MLIWGNKNASCSILFIFAEKYFQAHFFIFRVGKKHLSNPGKMPVMVAKTMDWYAFFFLCFPFTYFSFVTKLLNVEDQCNAQSWMDGPDIHNSASRDVSQKELSNGEMKEKVRTYDTQSWMDGPDIHNSPSRDVSQKELSNGEMKEKVRTYDTFSNYTTTITKLLVPT